MNFETFSTPFWRPLAQTMIPIATAMSMKIRLWGVEESMDENTADTSVPSVNCPVMNFQP